MCSHRFVLIVPVITVSLSLLVSGISSQWDVERGSELQQTARHPKMFGAMLGFVTIPQSICQADRNIMGTCMRNKQCQRQNGTASGSCAVNFGTCCIINRFCKGGTGAEQITINGTHIVNPPMLTDQCRYEIPRQEGVCQIRLDFNSFRLNQGVNYGDVSDTFTKQGDCIADSLYIGGSSNAINMGALCGDLQGQHMYLEYGSNEKISLDFTLKDWMAQQWDITVTMIRCDSTERAPPGCLQYYTTQSNTVKSFNYNNMTQLNNEDYSVCVRTNPGMRKITWKTCMSDSSTSDFSITGDGNQVIGESFSGDDCQKDWVMILGSNKYCGNQFPDSVSSITQPFILQVHFDDVEVVLPMDPETPIVDLDTDNKGFCLKYTQSPF